MTAHLTARRGALGYRALAAAALLCACAVPAWAQTAQPDRAYRGLFTGKPPNPDQHNTLVFDASLFAAYDDNVLADQSSGTIQPTTPLHGTYAGLDAGAMFNHTGHKIDFGASGGANVRYYQDLKDLVPVGYQGSFGFALHGQHDRLQVNANGNYSPYFTFNMIPYLVPVGVGVLPPQAADTVVDKRTTYGFGGNVGFDHTINQRSGISVYYDGQQIDFSGNAQRLRSQGAGGRYHYQFARDASVHFGYGYQQAQFASGPASQANIHNLDLGVDYRKPLGRTRRTTVGFSVGSTIISQVGFKEYRLLGDASLDHQFYRTWTARVAYHRGAGVMAGFNQPYFSDTLATMLSGWLTERLDFNATAGYSKGDFGVTGTLKNNYDTYTASARLRFALNAETALYGEYTAYRYDFDSRVALPFLFPNHVNRQGVRGGVTFFLPVYR